MPSAAVAGRPPYRVLQLPLVNDVESLPCRLDYHERQWIVLTAVGDYAYKRKDGVIVCPISALRP